MRAIFYVLSCDKTKIRMTKKPELNLINVYFTLEPDIRKRIADGSVTFEEIKVIEGTQEDINKEFERLQGKHDPKVKRIAYNKKYYQKQTTNKYVCSCGSTMINRKQIIMRHEKTQKHINSLK